MARRHAEREARRWHPSAVPPPAGVEGLDAPPPGYAPERDHPRGGGVSSLFGRRVMLRPLTVSDFPAWQEVRRRNTDWLTRWEPSRLPGQPDLIPYRKDKGVGVINASPTGMGLLTPQGGPAWHPASKAIVEGCRKAVEYCKAKGVNIIKLAVQYSCSHPDIATTLVGTAQPDAIRANIAYAQEPMDERLVAEVLEILKPIHRFNFTRGRPEHRDPLLAVS